MHIIRKTVGAITPTATIDRSHIMSDGARLKNNPTPCRAYEGYFFSFFPDIIRATNVPKEIIRVNTSSISIQHHPPSIRRLTRC